MKKIIRTSHSFNYLSAFIAFTLWGCWAYYINNSYSTNSGIISGLAQGAASFMITLFMVHFVTYLYGKFSHPVSKLLLPAIVTVCITSICLIILHILVGTPQVFYTVSPALSIAFSFCLYTTFKIHKINQMKNYE